jgi:hypothetical protein
MKNTAYNTGLAKVAFQRSTETFMVKIANFAMHENVMHNKQTQ